ncbi:hypothetical protein [Comamonas jiangduensis]|uniref:PBCV-specific basic adaptor domain-containing protein n=1 Tax=Comamonas jiangduensis TaxID=1194168 RepID=A0ABV4IGI4_9BURK
MQTSRCALACLLLGVAFQSYGANTPCSGRKGGIDHCMGSQFVCKDGSLSASRKICSDTRAPAAARAFQAPAATDTSCSCSCRSGAVCTGPRGGRYCLSDSGRKSYVRR